MGNSEDEEIRGERGGENLRVSGFLLFSVLHSCRSHLEGETGPSEVLPWKLFCSPTGKSCDVT